MMSRVLTILETIRPGEPFATSQDYLQDGLLDSFDIVAVVAELDGAFSVSIPGARIVPENFRNKAAILSLMHSLGATACD